MEPVEVILSGAIIAIIGALPFGLVNLSVLYTSYREGKARAMKIAHGAAWIEVLFGILALLAGSTLLQFTEESRLAKYLIVLIPGITGLAFLLKKNGEMVKSDRKGSGFFKGFFLNLVSIQVLMYWFIAVAFLNAKQFNIEPPMFLYFSLGIWLGKMFVLWLYSRISGAIFSRAASLANNINRIIGSMLIITAVIQFIK